MAKAGLDQTEALQQKSKKTDRLTVNIALDSMRRDAERILYAIDKMRKLDENSADYQMSLDSSKFCINEYVQAFVDVVSVIYINCEKGSNIHTESLRSVIRFFTSYGFQYSADCGKWIEFLIRRNDLVHEYYNYEFLNEELKSSLVTYEDCIMELIGVLDKIVVELGIGNTVIRKGR